jgi:outer membrane protein assembly factor BamA
MIWLLIIAMLLPGAGFGQTKKGPAAGQTPARRTAPAPAPVKPADRWPIQKLAVEGAPDYDTAQVIAASGLKIGQIAGRKEFDEATDRLLATGAFETVGYRFMPDTEKSYAAVFQVTEVKPILPVRFERLGVPDAELQTLLRSRDPLFGNGKLPASKAVIDRQTQWISEYLAAKNLDARITGSISPFPEALEVVFRPTRLLPAVAEVAFEGNQAIDEKKLREAISGAAVGLPYTERGFREVLDHSVRPVYEKEGRLRVEFPKLTTTPVTDVSGLRVLVTVAEGDVYKLGKVAIEGSSPIDAAALLRTGKFNTGEVANIDAVKEGMENMRKALTRAGYLNAAVRDERKIDDTAKTVDLALHIDEGPKYVMGKLEVVGLDLNGEAEIKRVWGLKAGAPFNADYPNSFLSRVKNEGWFDNLGETKAETKTDEQSHSVDVTLTFKGPGPKPNGPGRGPRPPFGR